MKNPIRPRPSLAALCLPVGIGAALLAASLTGCSSEPSHDQTSGTSYSETAALGPETPASETPASEAQASETSAADKAMDPMASHAASVPGTSDTPGALAGTPQGPDALPSEDLAATTPPSDPMTPTAPEPESDAAPKTEVATVGAGCFWCIEAVLEQVDGVESVVSGYMGGQTENPTYKDICTGTTGHAEVVQVTFDPKVLPYKDLLDWFWRAHDPTTLNRQGADRGTQYRSAIFTHSDAQRSIAIKSRIDVAPTFDDPIVTEITPASTFYPAEAKHQGYYFDNSSQGYCRAVITPKLKKLGLKY